MKDGRKRLQKYLTLTVWKYQVYLSVGNKCPYCFQSVARKHTYDHVFLRTFLLHFNYFFNVRLSIKIQSTRTKIGEYISTTQSSGIAPEQQYQSATG